MVKIPKRIRVLGRTYTTKVVKDLRDEEDKKPLWGRVNHTSQQILLQRGLHPELKEQVFWHEVLHILTNSLELPLSEKDIERLGSGLFAVLIDNLIWGDRGRRKG